MRELSFRAGTEFPGRTVSNFLIRNSGRDDSLSADLKRWLAGSFSDPKLWPPAEAGRPECYTLNLVRKSETWPARSLYSILTQLVAWFLVESTPAEHGRCASPVRTCLVGRAASLRTRFRATPVRTYFVPRHHFSSPSTYRFRHLARAPPPPAPCVPKLVARLPHPYARPRTLARQGVARRAETPWRNRSNSNVEVGWVGEGTHVDDRSPTSPCFHCCGARRSSPLPSVPGPPPLLRACRCRRRTLRWQTRLPRAGSFCA